MKLLFFTNWKSKTYDLILVIIDWLIKMIYYKLVKIIINAFGTAKVIPIIFVYHYSLSNFILTNQGLVFISKF